MAELERAAPDSGHVAAHLRPRLGHLDLADRYPGTTGLVALVPAPVGIVGMLFSSVAPTQFNGAVVPGAYLFNLRVHPAVRRRGVATSLIGHALELARREAGIELAWSAIMSGNEPSVRTFGRAGFAPTRDVTLRIRLPGGRRAKPDPAWTLRLARSSDLPALADTFNRANARHNLWRPCAPDNLATQLGAAAHDLADVLLVESRDGRILAAGAAFDVRRAFAPESVDFRGVPRLLSRALSPLVSRVPLHPLQLRHRALPATEPRAALSLLRSIRSRPAATLSPLIVPVDPVDSAWPTIARATQAGRPLHVMIWSVTPIDDRRPVMLT